MKLSLYEIRKQLSGRLMWGVLALLVLLNMALCYYFTDSRTDETLLPAMKVADEVYREDPEGVLERYKAYKEQYDAYEMARPEWFFNKWNEDGTMKPEPTPPDFPSTFYEGWDDYSLINAYLEQVLTEEQYRTIIADGIESSERTLVGYISNGYDSDSFAYRYQLRYHEVYSGVLENVQIKGGCDYGWDILFSYNGTGLFIFLAALFVGSRLFLTERDCGMHLLLRTARHGRGKQAFAKTVAAALLSMLITVLFFASSMLVIGSKVGFSSPAASVQQISAMVYCPYELNMFTALLATMAMTLLAAFAICLLTACFSLFTRRSLFAMLLSAVVVGLSYVFSNYIEQDFLKYVNIFTATSGEALFGQWRAVHCFSHPIEQLLPLTVMLVGLLILSALIGWGVWDEVGVGVSATNRNRSILPIAAWIEKMPRLRIRSLGLGYYEQKKLLPTKLTLLCIALIALKVILSVNAFDGELSYRDELKMRYMAQYEHMTLAESYDAVNEKLAYYAEISSDSYIDEMAVKVINGEITADEYNAYRGELSEAVTYKKSLEGFAEELGYLLEKEAETGIEAKPVFSIGVRNLFASDFEPILFILLMLLFCGSYAKEYETGFMSLLHSTKRGRKHVFFTKLAWVVGISLICTLAFTLLDLGLVFAHYDMACTSAPLFAISTYSFMSSRLTIGSYLLFVTVLRTVSYTLLGVLIAALSGCLRSEWSAAGVTLLTLIPYLLGGLGLTIFEPIDITAMLSVDRLWLTSWAQGSAALFIVFISVAVAVTAILTVFSYRKFCK